MGGGGGAWRQSADSRRQPPRRAAIPACNACRAHLPASASRRRAAATRILTVGRPLVDDQGVWGQISTC